MPNDAKLGLVFGVGLVIAVGVVFHRKDVQAGNAAAIDQAGPLVPGNAVAAKDATPVTTTAARRHTVQSGETFATLARQYLGDEKQAAAIRSLNPAVQGSDEPAAGTVLVIPDVPPASR